MKREEYEICGCDCAAGEGRERREEREKRREERRSKAHHLPPPRPVQDREMMKMPWWVNDMRLNY